MICSTRRLRTLAAALILGLGAAIFAAPATTSSAFAQGAPASPAAAQEEVLFRYLQTQPQGRHGELVGRVSIPDRKAATLIQPHGREFQEAWRTTMKWVGAVAILGMLGVLVLFYTIRGRIRISAGPSGRYIDRFDGFERFAHWLTASTFVVLAITGLNISYGRHLLLPLIGPEAFTAWSEWGKAAHNFLGFPFTFGVLLMFVLWVHRNIPDGTDIQWLAKGGGLVGHAHPPAKKFNAGQKLVFWTTVLGGAAIAVTGFMKMFPFQFIATDVYGMQLATQIHGIVGFIMIALILGHIYIGTLGMEGAFSAMGSGKVDLNWAKEHHSLWVDEVMNPTRKASLPAGAKGAGAD